MKVFFVILLNLSFFPVIIQVPVPRFAVGIVIGRNGEMIKKIQNDTGVRIQFKPGERSGSDSVVRSFRCRSHVDGQ